MFSIDAARTLLATADVFFEADQDDNPIWNQTLNLNDTWAWASCDGEHVPDEELPRVAELFWRYGNCGILFWVSERRDNMRSEFHNINRFIEFVRQEEKIRAEEQSPSKRAYTKRKYVVGQ